MTKLEQLKNQLEIAEKKYEESQGDDWLWGYIDGLKRAIEIMEENK